ncbi:MAG: hypothetical protein ACI81W_001518 [Saprospiraceae bacterium]
MQQKMASDNYSNYFMNGSIAKNGRTTLLLLLLRFKRLLMSGKMQIRIIFLHSWLGRIWGNGGME